MKLNATQQNTIEEQFGIEAIADDHPAIEKLKEVFGDHTFFLDAGGLNVVEPHPDSEAAAGAVVKLASWTDDQSQLNVHEPEVLPIAVKLDGGS